MTSLNEQLVRAADRLGPVTETPRLDAEILMAHALRTSRTQLLSRLHHDAHVPAFDVMLERRLAYEPIAYITGSWEFFSLEFLVKPPMLVPRPETEHLVETVLGYLDSHCQEPEPRVLEIGTGTGCVAISIARHAPRTRIIATDSNPDAVGLARLNAAMVLSGDQTPTEIGAPLPADPWQAYDEALVERFLATINELTGAGHIAFREGDLFQALPQGEPCFNVICSNPPYIAEKDWPRLPAVVRLYEDPNALLAGPEGLDCIERLAFEATAYLEPGGLLAFEIGMGQDARVSEILADNNYVNIEIAPDLAGIPRIASARKPNR